MAELGQNEIVDMVRRTHNMAKVGRYLGIDRSLIRYYVMKYEKETGTRLPRLGHGGNKKKVDHATVVKMVRHEGNMSEVARILGVSPNAIYAHVKRHEAKTGKRLPRNKRRTPSPPIDGI